ncbi:MAG: hypothetical protein AAF992_25560 [Bacteroidota bacterium]
MEKERNPQPSTELQTVGYQAADTLRSYGYPDLAQEYERVLHRALLTPNEMLALSRIASTALKELNALSQEKHGGHPALAKNQQIQTQLDLALKQHTALEPPKRLEDLSFSAKLYLEEHSKPLERAAQKVRNYLDEKRAFLPSEQGYQQEGKTKLQTQLEAQLNSFRTLPTAYNMESLEAHTREGLAVMTEDYRLAKEAAQKDNERYVAERNFLSAEGRAQILREAEKEEFELPNRQKGHMVASRMEYAQQQLDQYTQTKAKIISIDQHQQNQLRQPSVISGSALEHNEPEVDRIDMTKTSLRQDYAQLPAEVQEHYAYLQSKITSTTPAKNQEREL